MKKIISFGIILLALSCSSDQKKAPELKKETVKPVKKVETIQINKEKIVANWTAYKFTERAGVSGVFNTINIKNELKGKSIQEVLKGLKFDIPVTGINSNNPERDKKLVNNFFNTMKNTSSLTGIINSVTGTNNQGTCSISFLMNDLSKPIKMEYHLVDNQYYVLKGILDLENWEGQEAINSLNKVCEKLHIGKDGISKLWPDVKVVIQLPLKK